MRVRRSVSSSSKSQRTVRFSVVPRAGCSTCIWSSRHRLCAKTLQSRYTWLASKRRAGTSAHLRLALQLPVQLLLVTPAFVKARHLARRGRLVGHDHLELIALLYRLE